MRFREGALTRSQGHGGHAATVEEFSIHPDYQQGALGLTGNVGHKSVSNYYSATGSSL